MVSTWLIEPKFSLMFRAKNIGEAAFSKAPIVKYIEQMLTLLEFLHGNRCPNDAPYNIVKPAESKTKPS